MRKLYGAYIIEEMVEYFEKKLTERKDDVKIVYTDPVVLENSELLTYYILEAEEGIIEPKWELK